ncbi:MAG: DUF4199 domain-containing protein [Janthinobacterium lividum]
MATNTTPTPTGPVLTPERNGVRFGLLTASALCVYTLLAVLLKFFSHIEAGSVDVLLLIVGAVLAIRNFRNVRGDHMPYLGGYGTGIITALIASLILGLFFLVIVSVFPRSVDLTQVHNVFSNDDYGIIAFLSIVLMGTMAGVITSLVAMQYFKVQVSDPLHMLDKG